MRQPVRTMPDRSKCKQPAIDAKLAQNRRTKLIGVHRLKRRTNTEIYLNFGFFEQYV